MAYFDQAPKDITPGYIDDTQEVLPGIDTLLQFAEARSRHVGQGVLELEELMAV